MSNTTINFEAINANINSALEAAKAMQESAKAMQESLTQKLSSLSILKKEYEDGLEAIQDIAQDQKAVKEDYDWLLKRKEEKPNFWHPDNQADLDGAINKMKELDDEKISYAMRVESLKKNINEIYAELQPKEEVAANKVETPKLEVKKDTALEDKSAKIQFADGGKYRVILSNGKELDCSISNKMSKYLDGIDTQKFYGTFSIKYDKNRFKDAKQEWFLCSVSVNN